MYQHFFFIDFLTDYISYVTSFFQVVSVPLAHKETYHYRYILSRGLYLPLRVRGVIICMYVHKHEKNFPAFSQLILKLSVLLYKLATLIPENKLHSRKRHRNDITSNYCVWDSRSGDFIIKMVLSGEFSRS